MFEVNGVTYESASVPVLLQILSGTTNPSQLLPNGSVYALPGNASIELSIPGGALGGGVCIFNMSSYHKLAQIVSSIQSIFTE